MGRPSKPVAVLKEEKKSHRTSRELAYRAREEQDTLTGEPIIEPASLKENKIAHKEFLRVRRILRKIKKDDELYGNPVRRYCMNAAKLEATNKTIDSLMDELERLKESRQEYLDQDDLPGYYKMLTAIGNLLTKEEGLAKDIRREMDSFEKENCMTIASSLRSIPKTPTKKKSALEEALLGP